VLSSLFGEEILPLATEAVLASPADLQSLIESQVPFLEDSI